MMARHNVAYDHANLVELAEQTTTSTNLEGVALTCKYVQETVVISSRAQVTFQWNATTLDHQAEERVRVHAGMCHSLLLRA